MKPYMHKLKKDVELRVLKIHQMLPGRKVRLLTDKETKKQGWTSGKHEDKFNKTGHVVEIHTSVFEAVKVLIGDDCRFWHFKDLQLVTERIKLPKPVLFDPKNLDV